MNQHKNIESEIDLIELAKVLWNKRKAIIKSGFIGGCIGIVIAFSLPKVYTSSVVMVPEVQSSSSSMSSLGGLASLAGISIGGESVGITEQLYPQIVASRPFIFEFADMMVDVEGKDMTLLEYFVDEYKRPWWSVVFGAPFKALGFVLESFRGEEPEGDGSIDLKALTKDQENYAERFAELINLSIDSKTFVMTLNVSTQSPEISLMLADSLLVALDEYMAMYKTSKIRAELKSNVSMLRKARANYYEADSIYAAAVDSRRNIISKVANISLDRLSNEKDIRYQIYSQIASKVELNKTQLNEQTPILTVIEPATMPIKASSPHKMMILVAFAFLGGAIVVGKETFIFLQKQDDEADA